MSFFSNPFSYKRRRGAELEIGTPDQISPETPPTASNVLQTRRQEKPSPSLTDSPPSSLSPSPSQQTTTIQVRDRAQYFESLIRSKAGGRATKEEEGGKDGLSARILPSKCPPQSAALFGGLTAAAAADALQNLRLELNRVENEKLATVEALRRKTQEAENLQNIVRELSESRAAALTARATLAEQYVDLSRAHERVTRVADLSRAVSKENLELTRTARSIAAGASKEAEDARREAAAAGKAEMRAAEENAILRQKVNLLERIVSLNSTRGGGSGQLHFSGEAGCQQEFTLPIETY
jgi:hypothetical protein